MSDSVESLITFKPALLNTIYSTPKIQKIHMKKSLITLLAFISVYSSIDIFAQQQLLTNGDFENSQWYFGWYSINSNGNCWGGNGYCLPHSGNKSMWMGDQYEQNGVNGLNENLYQSVNIPSGLTSCYLEFAISGTTNENTTSTSYDFFYVTLRSSSNQLLTTLYTHTNLDVLQGIPNCHTWDYVSVQIPQAYFGQNVRISFECTTDGSLPTIFRLDNVSLLATTSCNYSISQTSYTCPGSLANNYANVASITTSPGCNWNATVTSGGSWLSTTSSGNGNGNINISVTANTSTSSRTGTIDIAGQTLTIQQPGINCTYSLSQNNYTCPGSMAGNYLAANVQTSSTCSWNAAVTTGGSWLSTTSSGTGTGALNITVSPNSGTISRTGTILVAGQVLTITQPALNCSYNLSQYNYNCSDTYAGTALAAHVIAPDSCTWNAAVISGGSWLSTTSSGVGDGFVMIQTTNNQTGFQRTGQLNVAGNILTVTQPGVNTSVQDYDQTWLNVHIFPNPTQDEICITGIDTDISEYKLYNFAGICTLSGKTTNQPLKIDLNSIESGVYMLQIKTCEKTGVFKVVKY